MDGLEPQGDLVEAARREQQRVNAGWAPFWHYRGLGMYGRQVEDLLDHFPREQVLLLRYRTLVDHPVDTLDRVSDFLGVERARVASVPSDNSRPFVQHGRRAQTLGAVIRAGARVGQFFPPEVWRRASRPLIAQLHKGGDPNRPALTPDQRDRAPRAAPARHRAARAGHGGVVRRVEGLPRRRVLLQPADHRRRQLSRASVRRVADRVRDSTDARRDSTRVRAARGRGPRRGGPSRRTCEPCRRRASPG